MFCCTGHEKSKMNKKLVPMFLPLLLLASVTPVTSRLNSITVISYRGLRKTKTGEVLCAMDTANDTISSSSQQQCSLKCAKDATCTGFNIKNELTCDTYNYKPMLSYRDSTCKFYQVGYISSVVVLEENPCPRGPIFKSLSLSFFSEVQVLR